MEAQAQRQTDRQAGGVCGAAGEPSPGFYKAGPRVGGSACAAAAAGGQSCWGQMLSNDKSANCSNKN